MTRYITEYFYDSEGLPCIKLYDSQDLHKIIGIDLVLHKGGKEIKIIGEDGDTGVIEIEAFCRHFGIDVNG